MLLSSLLPLIIGTTGLFLLCRLKFFFFLHPQKTLRAFLSELSEKESRKAFFLALAGTLGVGNIFGTAAGIMIGGAGSVFWLLLSSLFSSVLKFSETALTLDLKDTGKRGLQSVLPKIFKKSGRTLGVIYSFLCFLLSLFMGAAVQSSAVSDICAFSLDFPKILTAFLLCLLVYFGAFGGVSRIEKATSFLVPLATVIFIGLSLLSLVINKNSIPGAVSLIFSEALSEKAFSGGVLGFLSSKALTEGFARGILSNEAGVGTSAMAHSRADKRAPFVGGLFGLAEVIVDTVIICTLTALALLSSPIDYRAYSTPMSYVASAFKSTFGAFSTPLLIFSILVFAYSTMICWYYYGDECLTQLFGKKYSIYMPLFLTAVTFGTLIGAKSLLQITDTVIFLMALITISALIYSHRRIESLTEDFLKKH